MPLVSEPSVMIIVCWLATLKRRQLFDQSEANKSVSFPQIGRSIEKSTYWSA